MYSQILCVYKQKYIDMHMKNVGIIITSSKYNYKYKNKIR